MDRRKPKYVYALELFNYWAGKLKIPETRSFKDKRFTKSYMAICDQLLVYNPITIGRLSQALIINCVLHELGHLINAIPYDTEKDRITSEYVAERYALDMMKRHYAEHVPEVIAWTKKKLKEKKYIKSNPIHYQAYSMIKEYQDAE